MEDYFNFLIVRIITYTILKLRVSHFVENSRIQSLRNVNFDRDINALMMNLIGSKINTKILISISNITRYTKFESLNKLLEGQNDDIPTFDIDPSDPKSSKVLRVELGKIRFHLRVTIMSLNKQLFLASPAPM